MHASKSVILGALAFLLTLIVASPLVDITGEYRIACHCLKQGAWCDGRVKSGELGGNCDGDTLYNCMTSFQLGMKAIPVPCHVNIQEASGNCRQGLLMPGDTSSLGGSDDCQIDWYTATSTALGTSSVESVLVAF